MCELSLLYKHKKLQTVFSRPALTLVSLAIAIASCPAPLISKGVSVAAAAARPDMADTVDRAACFSWAVSSGSQGVAGAECWPEKSSKINSVSS